MSKRERAMRIALAMHRFARNIEAGRYECWGMQRYQFAMAHEMRAYKGPKEIREAANKIARSQNGKT